jgi:Common central domain of tyrosinase
MPTTPYSNSFLNLNGEHFMALGDGIRRDVAKISQVERDRFRDAILQLKSAKMYPDGISYWDKQEQIHKDAHVAGQDVHAGPAFLAWHRELINRFEDLLREVDPQLSLHYWDWTTDPRVAQGGRAALFTPTFMGNANGDMGAPFANFVSTEPENNKVWRNLSAGAPRVLSDCAIIQTGFELEPKYQFQAMDGALRDAHNYMHLFYIGGTIAKSHYSFHDPFVFLLHSNVDRIWALWQRQPGQNWRLNPSQTYGIRDTAPSINANLEPWAGGSGTRPWAPPDNQMVVKTATDVSIVVPRAYDTDSFSCGSPVARSRGDSVGPLLGLFGAGGDGGSLWIGPNGHPFPVGPWGPIVGNIGDLSFEKRDILIGLATAQLGTLANHPETRKMLHELGHSIMASAISRSLDSGFPEKGGSPAAADTVKVKGKKV